MQIFLHHAGICRFKGVPEAQTVMSISRNSLAYRAVPTSYPSVKATQEGPFQGLKAIIVLPAENSN